MYPKPLHLVCCIISCALEVQTKGPVQPFRCCWWHNRIPCFAVLLGDDDCMESSANSELGSSCGGESMYHTLGLQKQRCNHIRAWIVDNLAVNFESDRRAELRLPKNPGNFDLSHSFFRAEDAA